MKKKKSSSSSQGCSALHEDTYPSLEEFAVHDKVINQELLPELKRALKRLYSAVDGEPELVAMMFKREWGDHKYATYPFQTTDFYELKPGLPSSILNLKKTSPMVDWERALPSAEAVYSAFSKASDVAMRRYFDADKMIQAKTLADNLDRFLNLIQLELIPVASSYVKVFGSKKKAAGQGGDPLGASRKLPKGVESPDDVYGRVAFAPDRTKEAPPPFREPNTQEENTAIRALHDHFENSMPMPKDVCSQLSELLAAKKYSDVLVAPGSNVLLMRGMLVTRSWLLRIVARAGDDIAIHGIKIDPKADVIKFDSLIKPASLVTNFVYKPLSARSPSSSWTTSWNVAEQFSLESAEDAPRANFMYNHRIIMKARAGDNPNAFIMGPGGLYNLKPAKGYTGEKEAVALGNINVYEIEIFPN